MLCMLNACVFQHKSYWGHLQGIVRTLWILYQPTFLQMLIVHNKDVIWSVDTSYVYTTTLNGNQRMIKIKKMTKIFTINHNVLRTFVSVCAKDLNNTLLLLIILLWGFIFLYFDLLQTICVFVLEIDCKEMCIIEAKYLSNCNNCS